MPDYKLVVITEGTLTVHEGDEIPDGYDGPIVPADTEETEETA